MDPTYAEEKESLWSAIRAPLVWSVHFMACYLTAAVFCAKFAPPSGSLTLVRLIIAGYTVPALAFLTFTAISGCRRARSSKDPRGQDTPRDRYAFMGYLDLLLSILGIIGVVMSALPAVFIETCQ